MSAVKRTVDEFRVDRSHRDIASRNIDVVGSRMPGFGKVILYRANAAVKDQEPQFSWIHMETETRSFDDFLRFASNVPNLADEDRALVLSLLKRARLKEGRSDMPSDVMRCVGFDSKVPDKVTEERSAIFLRMPYYSIQKMRNAARDRLDSCKPPRSLLQYYYNLESTRKRGLEQVIRKVGLFQPDNIVHVSQLWAVIVNFRLIITSAPMSLLDGASSSLEIMDPPVPKSTMSASIICVVDPLQRVFSFPIDQCRTYFVLYTRPLL
ncbi:hypothetical protein BJX61DRAFT_522752 [Aspergillus egyptiacus]|nr:hypothetical protein BJX61DRAFT_522752 [Aspergillus egyptiacus]